MFARHLWEKDSDIFVFMARKAACLFECLRELKQADVRGVAVNDRILDLDLSIFRGKTVTLVDDCVFSGTSLYQAKRVIEAAGCARCDTLPLSVNKKWLRPMLFPGMPEANDLNLTGPLTLLDDSTCVQQCFEIVRAISIMPRPYDVDFPHSKSQKISTPDLDCLMHLPGWIAQDVSSAYQSRFNVRVLSFVPAPHVLQDLMGDLPGVATHMKSAKIRIYARKLSDASWSIRVMPVAMLGAVATDQLVNSSPVWPKRMLEALIKVNATSATSRYRLLQFLVALFVYRRFALVAKRYCEVQVHPKFQENLAAMSFGIALTNRIDEMLNDLGSLKLPIPISEPDPPAIARFGDRVVKVDSQFEVMSECIKPFTWLYRNLEIKARRFVKENGLAASISERTADLTRLRKGFSFRRLESRLTSTTLDIQHYVTLSLDKLIDLGIAVPTTVEHEGLVYRAFRHGEDAPFGDAEERLTVMALQQYMATRAINELTGLELQKFIVLFIQIASREGGLIERLKSRRSVSSGTRILTIKGHLHGLVPMVTCMPTSGSLGAPFLEGNDVPLTWLVSDWESRNIISSKDIFKTAFDIEDITDREYLLYNLRSREIPGYKYIAELLNPRTDKHLKESHDQWAVSNEILEQVVEDLNRLLTDQILWKGHIAKSYIKKLRSWKRIAVELEYIPTSYDSRRFIEHLLKGGLKPTRRVAKRYKVRRVPNLSIGRSREARARSIGRCLGRLVGPGRPLNNDNDLVMLSCCWEADHQLRALSGELSIINSTWKRHILEAQKLELDGKYDDAIRLLTSRSMYTALNSGAWKFRCFVDQEILNVNNRVLEFVRADDVSGTVEDEWLQLWPEASTPTRRSTSPTLWNCIHSMGEWLITFNVGVRIYIRWLAACRAGLNARGRKGEQSVVADCTVWFEYFKKYCSGHLSTSFGNIVSNVNDWNQTGSPQEVELNARTSLTFLETLGLAAVERLLVDSTLACTCYSTFGEITAYQYAVYFEIEQIGLEGEEAYTKYLKFVSEFLNPKMVVLPNSLNQWDRGIWILCQGNRDSQVASGLCHGLVKEAVKRQVRTRAILFGQLHYDDCVRGMTESPSLAVDYFFRRIQSLRVDVFPNNFGSSVIATSEESPTADSEAKKFAMLSGGTILNSKVVNSFTDALPKRRYTVAEVKLSDRVRRLSRPPTVDIGIITIREDEFLAVLSRFPGHRLVKGSGSNYEVADVQTREGRTLHVAVARCPDQGQVAAQALTSTMLQDVSPKWIFVVGIAGQMPTSDHTLGDVLISHRMHDFSVGAALEGRSPEFQDLGGPMVRDVIKLVTGIKGRLADLDGWNSEAEVGLRKPSIDLPADANADSLYGDPQWRERVLSVLRAHFPNGSPKRLVAEFYSTIVISGNTLVKDTSLAELWQRNARSASVIEMELGGVVRAAQAFGTGKTRIMPIRGVSDIVGFKRSSEWTAFACQSAAAFVGRLVRSGLVD